MVKGISAMIPAIVGGLLAAAILFYRTLPPSDPSAGLLAVAIGMLALAFLLLLSFKLAARPSRPAHAFSVLIRILAGIFLFFLAFQIVRDFESKNVTRDTWLTLLVLIAGILGFNAPRIIASRRRADRRRKATGLAAGTIYRIIGETSLDRDDDPVTSQLACIRYTVDGIPYEIRAGVSRALVRRYGKQAFIGREIPVRFDPADPAGAAADKIDRHLFDPPAK